MVGEGNHVDVDLCSYQDGVLVKDAGVPLVGKEQACSNASAKRMTMAESAPGAA